MEVLLRPIVSEMDRAIFLGLGLFFTFYTFYTFFTLFYFRGTFKAVTGGNIRPGVFLLWRGMLKVLAPVL